MPSGSLFHDIDMPESVLDEWMIAQIIVHWAAVFLVSINATLDIMVLLRSTALLIGRMHQCIFIVYRTCSLDLKSQTRYVLVPLINRRYIPIQMQFFEDFD
jgi:hypothetical protein